MARKLFMTFIWRIAQTGPILSLFFWSTALAGIFWPILGDRGAEPDGPLWVFLVNSLHISASNATLVGLLLLFLVFASVIVLIGLLYDRVLELWREQMTIAYERNPYADDLMYRKEILMWQQYFLPLARAVYKVSPDPDLQMAIRRVEDWIATGKVKPK